MRPVLRGEFGDLPRFAPAGVILPEPALGLEVLAPLRVEGERAVVPVHRQRARSGGVDAEADDPGRVESALLLRPGERAPHALLKAEEIVAGMLPGQVVVLRVEQHALPAAGIADDTRAKLGAVGAADDEGPHRIRAEINAKGE